MANGVNEAVALPPLPKIHEKVALLHKILLYFFIVAPGY